MKPGWYRIPNVPLMMRDISVFKPILGIMLVEG